MLQMLNNMFHLCFIWKQIKKKYCQYDGKKLILPEFPII